MYHATPDQIAYMQAHINENRQPWFIGANIAFLVVALGSVALRFLARIKIGTHLGLDDWLIFTAAVSCTVLLFGGQLQWNGPQKARSKRLRAGPQY
jgi:hypothetical protein